MASNFDESDVPVGPTKVLVAEDDAEIPGGRNMLSSEVGWAGQGSNLRPWD
jgi:hypothetical protein